MTDATDGPSHRGRSFGWRYAAAWGLALVLAAAEMFHARFAYEDTRPPGDPGRRADGNPGHTSIDFGGQWVMGRLLTRGYARELYHRARQWDVAQQAYPRSHEAPDAAEHDAEKLLSWFMGRDDPAWA